MAPLSPVAGQFDGELGNGKPNGDLVHAAVSEASAQL